MSSCNDFTVTNESFKCHRKVNGNVKCYRRHSFILIFGEETFLIDRKIKRMTGIFTLLCVIDEIIKFFYK